MNNTPEGYNTLDYDHLLQLAYAGDVFAQDIISAKSKRFAEFQAQVDRIAEVMDKEYTVRIKAGNKAIEWLDACSSFYGDYMQYIGKFIKVKIDWTNAEYFTVTFMHPKLGCHAYLLADHVVTQLPEVRKMRALWKYWADAKRKLENK